MKESIDAIARHDLLVNRSHELEVVGAIGAGNPHLRGCPVPSRLPFRVHGDPVRVRFFRIVICGVRIGTDKDRHTQLAAAVDQLPKHIAVAEERAAMVKRNLRWIEGDTSPAA